jgi:translation initiation factor 2 subunit 1
MAILSDFPEEGEFVVASVKNVKNFGAFVTLDEYEGKEGFIHIAEVAAGWVKYIRDHVREGQRIVCKVLRVDKAKNHIDLSFKQVNEHQKREKIQQWKNENKAHKLIERVGEKLGKDKDWCIQNIGGPLVEYYGGLYAAFEAAVAEPEEFKAEWKDDWIDAFLEVARESIQLPYVNIKGKMELICPHRDGIMHLRKALELAEKTELDATIEARYLGAPKYEISVTAPNYKIAEEALKNAADAVIDYITKYDGEGKFTRRD